MDDNDGREITNENPSLLELATHTCASCKKQKRRCDKKLPSCSLCLRSHRVCDYTDQPSPNLDEISYLRAKILELEDQVTRMSDQESSPSDLVPSASYSMISCHACLFLDSEIYSYCNFTVPMVHVPVPAELLQIVGNEQDIDHLKSLYFQSVHTWMPIIGKASLNRLTERMQGDSRADLILLLLCMRLVLEVPNKQAERTSLYIASKQFHVALGMSGVLSLLTVQAGLLISTYELGHAILPAGYISVGECSRQGVALGIHNKDAPQMLPDPRNWVDWEERRRVWWAILILDRYITATSDGRPLCTEDPSNDTYIPSDDRAWDRSEMIPPERVLVSSPPTNNLSPFARMALASNLLGRVIRHCNDATIDLNFALQEITQLQRAISSLFNLLPLSTDHTTEEFYEPSAICLSALMKLCNHHSCDSFVDEGRPLAAGVARLVGECTENALRTMRETSIKTILFVQVLEKLISLSGVGSISPLVLHCIYRAAITLSWLASETGDEQHLIGVSLCRKVLQMMDLRWRAAGTFLGILQVAEEKQQQTVY